jgi:hypothetical protein
VVFEDGVTHRQKYQRWLGREAFTVLQAPDRIEAFALHPWPVGRPPAGHENDPPPHLPPGAPTELGGRPVYAVGRLLSVDFARRLSAILFDDATYSERSPPFADFLFKGCTFEAGLGYRIWSGSRSVDVMSGSGNLRDEWSGGDIDDARAAFVALAKEALPDVPQISAIPPVRRGR